MPVPVHDSLPFMACRCEGKKLACAPLAGAAPPTILVFRLLVTYRSRPCRTDREPASFVRVSQRRPVNILGGEPTKDYVKRTYSGDSCEMLAALIEGIEQKKIELDRLRALSAGALAQLEKYYDIELTYTSNAIEGNTLTHRETAEVIEHGITVGGKSLREDHVCDWTRPWAIT